ncbi:MAG TPA: GNAT family N-acetyltransferase [Deltaproteobacteria bacterium]|nr:GNAT family N-acetyltransferase [Deltaproteobacteria bacterium]
MTEPLFRKATPEDAAEIAALVVKTIRESCAPAYRDNKRVIGLWCADKTPANLAGTIGQQGNYTVVAIIDEHIMGVGLLHRYGEIALCYVHPYYQGRGIGKGLLEDMERKARALKIKTLLLKSTLNAVSFYQLHGYVNDGPIEMFLGEIRFQPMRKALTNRLRFKPPSPGISGANV